MKIQRVQCQVLFHYHSIVITTDGNDVEDQPAEEIENKYLDVDQRCVMSLAFLASIIQWDVISSRGWRLDDRCSQ